MNSNLANPVQKKITKVSGKKSKISKVYLPILSRPSKNTLAK